MISNETSFLQFFLTRTREYPGRAGAICNNYTPQDTANYLILLKELRAQMDKEFPNTHKYLTAAVRVQPWDDATGNPSSDLSAYVQYLDWICKYCFHSCTQSISFLLWS